MDIKTHPAVYVWLIAAFMACQSPGEEKEKGKTGAYQKITHNSITLKSADTCLLDSLLRTYGLVCLEDSLPGIKTDLRYSTVHNFMKMDLYGCLNRTYVLPEVVVKLTRAQKYLNQHTAGYKLLVFDGVRPLHIQKAMWDSVSMPVHRKIKFLSNPAYGSLHNYGAAVDVSLADSMGREVDMGTPFDDTSRLAWPAEEAIWQASGQLSRQQVMNRQWLRSAMYNAGFFGIQSEWWHFNAYTREEAKRRFKIIP